DIQTFRKQYNLPAADPQVLLFGANPGVTGDVSEAELDIQWSGAVAPAANIIYAYASDVVTAAQYVVDQDLAPVMSMSYGGCETSNSTSIRAIAQQASAEGITWMASSGDSGSVPCDYFAGNLVPSLGPTVDAPASIP